jgi:acetylornithine deacetylase/succinyl-diaminopimelate desuccinylase-like protein
MYDRLAEFSETPGALTCTYLTPSHHAAADVAMLFVRCGNGGISHSPLETVTAQDADIAARVLLDTILQLAGN